MDTPGTRPASSRWAIRSLVSRVFAAPALYWLSGTFLGYLASVRVSWRSGESYWDNALKWYNAPFFVALVAVCLVCEVLYRSGQLKTFRGVALIPFIVIQLRFGLWLLYYLSYCVFWMGFISAVALAVAAIIFAQNYSVPASAADVRRGSR